MRNVNCLSYAIYNILCFGMVKAILCAKVMFRIRSLMFEKLMALIQLSFHWLRNVTSIHTVFGCFVAVVRNLAVLSNDKWAYKTIHTDTFKLARHANGI